MKRLIFRVWQRVKRDVQDHDAKDFIKDTISLSSAKYFNTFLTATLTVALARFLGPASYGTYKLIMEAVDTVGFISRINSSIKRLFITRFPEYKQSSRNERIQDLLDLLVTFSIGIGLVTVAANYLLSGKIAAFYDNEGLRILLIIASLRLMFSSLNSLPSALLTAETKMQALSYYTSLKSIFSKGVPLALVVGGYGIEGAIIGISIIAPVLTLLVGFLFVKEWLRRIRVPSYAAIKRTLRTNDQFIGYLTFGQIVNSVFNSIPLLILGTQSTAAVGYLSIAMFGAQIPAILGSGIAENLAPRLPVTKVSDPMQFAKNVSTAAIYSTLVLTGLAAVGAVLTPFVIPLVLGSGYEPVVPIALILFLRPLGQGIGSVVGPASRALDIVKESALTSSAAQGLTLVAGLWIIPQFGAVGAAVVLVTGTILANGLVWLLIQRVYIPRLLTDSRPDSR